MFKQNIILRNEMNMKIKIIFSILLCLFFYCAPIYVLAQPPNPCPDPQLGDCPIDSDVFVLVIGAFVIAAKKAYDYNKNPQPI